MDLCFGTPSYDENGMSVGTNRRKRIYSHELLHYTGIYFVCTYAYACVCVCVMPMVQGTIETVLHVKL